MRPFSYSLMLTASVGALFAAQTVSAGTLSDDFIGPAGTDPDATLWTQATTNGNSSLDLDGNSNVVIDTNIANSSHRTFLVSNQTDFDPFAAPLQIDLEGIVIGGEPVDAFHVGGFVVIGRSAGDVINSYYPNGAAMSYGVAVSVREGVAGWDLHINEYTDNDDDSNPTDGTILYATHPLAGAPTGLTIVLDGENRSVGLEVDGTTFTSSGTASAVQPLSTHFTAENMTVDGEILSRISLGALNYGPTLDGAVLTLDSITAGPVSGVARLPGDANNDGTVDVVDLGILADNFRAAVTGGMDEADFNEDGTVDVVDLGILADNFRRVAGEASLAQLLPAYNLEAYVAAVPEPTSLALLGVGGLLLGRRTRRA